MFESLQIYLIVLSFVNVVWSDLPTQSLGISGNFLTTSVGIGQPAQYFDLAITLNSDNLIILDAKAQNVQLDFQYDYIKEMFFPEISNTANVTNLICRQHFGYFKTNKKPSGHYVADTITFCDNYFETPVRFCDFDTKRTADTLSDDPLHGFMMLNIDGFLGLKPGKENILQQLIPPDSSLQLTFYVDKNAQDPDAAGWMTFGGKDTTHCGTFRSFPSEDADSFSAWVTGTSFNGVSESDTYTAIFDLPYNDGMVVPEDVYNDISYYFDDQPKHFYCSSYANPPDLSVNFYGKWYIISIKDLIVKQSPQYCSLQMTAADSDDEYQFVFGRNFFNEYCLFLDYEDSLIGLASVK
ncbi:hypothetical protein M3Y97_00008200 [Aphelenchoides bicaudatus]|nr:hypothetical protein M3Y97_00008200 [Aphelenchoides bicaudatus]